MKLLIESLPMLIIQVYTFYVSYQRLRINETYI